MGSKSGESSREDAKITNLYPNEVCVPKIPKESLPDVKTMMHRAFEGVKATKKAYGID